jgi:aryl-alcohol dehydrogenase-like predicted oxidoreductase
VNEELLGRAIRGKRSGLVIATKFGFRFPELAIDSSPANVKQHDGSLSASASRRSTSSISTAWIEDSIEDTVGAVADLIHAGKVPRRALGCSAATLRRAAAVHPIAALQSEYSLWERGVEAEIPPTARSSASASCPSLLGRGFLGPDQEPRRARTTDYRHQDPRFIENFAKILVIVEALNGVGRARGTSVRWRSRGCSLRR